MAKYTVHVVMEVSSTVEVEADSPKEAIEAAYDSPDMPGGITVGAFGSASVDDGDWEALVVHVEGDDEPVWTRSTT